MSFVSLQNPQTCCNEAHFSHNCFTVMLLTTEGTPDCHQCEMAENETPAHGAGG